MRSYLRAWAEGRASWAMGLSRDTLDASEANYQTLEGWYGFLKLIIQPCVE